MIPVFNVSLSSKAKKYVNECLDSGWISEKGPFVDKFSNAFAKYLDIKYAVPTTSGTSALHLAVAAAGIGPGDEVIVTSFTMISPVYAILYTGATPVFVDIQLDTWCMNVDDIEAKITKKTKAILAVHIYGNVIDMDPLIKLAKKYKLLLIEDAAEALGSEYKDRKIGTFGDFSCFSFYANKLVTTGEGGMVVTNDAYYHKRLQILKDMAHSPKKRFLHMELAFTYRMTNLQAAIGLAQLEEIAKNLQKKINIAHIYQKMLTPIAGIQLPVEKPHTKNSYWMFGIVLNKKFGMSRDQMKEKLIKKGIDTRTFFVAMDDQPVLQKMGLINTHKYPNSRFVSRSGCYLPSGFGITKRDLKYICETIKDIHNEYL